MKYFMVPFKGESAVLSARTVLTVWHQHPEQFLALHQKLMQKKGLHNAESGVLTIKKGGANSIISDEKVWKH